VIVVGSPLHLATDQGPRAAGLAVAIARAARAAGADVEIVGKVGEDPAADAVLLDLAAAGIGHVAVLRDAGRATGEAPPGPPLDPAPFDEPLPDASGMPSSPAPADAPPADRASLEAADIELALRYLPDYRVVVVADQLAPAALDAAAAAARWASAALVVIVGQGATPQAALGEDATVLQAPEDVDVSFARVVGEYAARLDRGELPGDAFAAASKTSGWTAAEDA
jgi:hypothetical protein